MLTRLAGAIAWRGPGRTEARLISFARAERGSMIDLQLAAARTPVAERAAAYLRHAADEARHAVTFAKRAGELRRARGAEGAVRADADSEALYETLGEQRFLAFVHLGERRGRRQFEAHRAHFAARGDERMVAMFDAILTDERRHEAYTWDLLVALAGGERLARAAVRRAALWEAWRTWRRAGRWLAHAVWLATTTLLYLLCAPLALLVRLIRPARPGLHPPRPSVF